MKPKLQVPQLPPPEEFGHLVVQIKKGDLVLIGEAFITIENRASGDNIVLSVNAPRSVQVFREPHFAELGINTSWIK